MIAIPRLFSAPLNPILIVEHFRRSHPQGEHNYWQGIWVGKTTQRKCNRLNDKQKTLNEHVSNIRKEWGVTAFWASPRFGHPHSQFPSVLGIPFCSVLGIPRYPPGMPKSLVLWWCPPKNSGFRGKIENVLELDSAKYRNLFKYLKKKVYPEGFTKQDKTTQRKFAKKFVYDSKLFAGYGQRGGWHRASMTCYHRGRESESLRRGPLCSFFWTRRPR